MVQYQGLIVNIAPHCVQYCTSSTIDATWDFILDCSSVAQKCHRKEENTAVSKIFSLNCERKKLRIKRTATTTTKYCHLGLTLAKTCEMVKISFAWVQLKLNFCPDRLKLSCATVPLRTESSYVENTEYFIHAITGNYSIHLRIKSS